MASLVDGPGWKRFNQPWPSSSREPFMLAIRRFILVALCVAMAPSLALAGQPKKDKKEPAEPDKVSFYRNVRPIIQQHCQGCHQPAKAQGGFVMTSYGELLKKGNHEEPGVVPGQPDKSYI